jgi:hypothetical protein
MDVFICFVDFKKAFDRVDSAKMLQILRNVGGDWNDRRLIMNLYIQQKTVAKVGHDYSEESDMGRGVSQGCCLSLLLFTVCGSNDGRSYGESRGRNQSLRKSVE